MKKETETIRVVCRLPLEVNQKLQAQASLDGISKQQLTADILTDYVKGLKLSRRKQEQ